MSFHHDNPINLLVGDSDEGGTLHLFDVVSIVTEEPSHAGLADFIELVAGECDFSVAALVEMSVADTSSVELFGENAQEGWTGKCASHVRFQRSSDCQVDIFVVDI